MLGLYATPAQVLAQGLSKERRLLLLPSVAAAPAGGASVQAPAHPLGQGNKQLRIQVGGRGENRL